MFNKFTSKPIELPMLSDDEDVKDKTDKTNDPTQDDILGEPHKLVDLPAERIAQNTVVADGRVSYDNIKESPKAEKDILSTLLHTINSQQSLDLPVPFTPLKQEVSDDKLDLSFQAFEVAMPKMKYMALISLQDCRESNNDQGVSTSDGIDHAGPSLHTLETVAQQLEQHKTEPKTGQTKAEKSIDRIVYKIIFLVMLVLLSGIGYALKKSPVDNDETCQQIAVEPDVTARNNTAIAYSPFAASKGKSVTINIDVEGVSVQYKRNATTTEIETFSIESWETIGTTSLHASLIALLTLISVLSKWKSKACGAKKSDSPMIKTEKVIGDFDLSAYNNLKVVELRDLLRRRSCNTIGKKSVLIKRLAIVYQAGLDTLTVVQLRKLLKSKNYTQTGSKDAIIRTLVEAGI
jgi:hypothetical protein